ncbi:MAG: hypothetical protein RI952_1372 [Bacteroidota bacterium]|jgi:hypothetical protein
MDNSIKDALAATIAGFQQGALVQADDISAKEIFEQLSTVFESEEAFMDKVAMLDKCIDDFPKFDPIREYLFDLLMINFFAADALQLEEDYLESEEWEAIEDQTIDRGTEMLNLLLYIKECKEEGLDPDLDDYLKEFLLVEDDEFQDEHAIYEDIIANQILIDAPYSEIARVQDTLNAQSEIKEWFYPIVSFFASPAYKEEDFSEYLSSAPNKAMDAATLASLLAYYHGTDRFNHSFFNL